MKKSIIIALFIFCIFTLVSCDNHTHNYAAATCYSPETCTICGATRGDAVPHNYEEVSKDKIVEATPEEKANVKKLLQKLGL